MFLTVMKSKKKSQLFSPGGRFSPEPNKNKVTWGIQEKKYKTTDLCFPPLSDSSRFREGSKTVRFTQVLLVPHALIFMQSLFSANTSTRGFTDRRKRTSAPQHPLRTWLLSAARTNARSPSTCNRINKTKQTSSATKSCQLL